MAEMHPDVESVVLSEEDIRRIVSRMGRQISEDYADKNPLIVAVLRGAFVFTADLMRAPPPGAGRRGHPGACPLARPRVGRHLGPSRCLCVRH